MLRRASSFAVNPSTRFRNPSAEFWSSDILENLVKKNRVGHVLVIETNLNECLVESHLALTNLTPRPIFHSSFASTRELVDFPEW